MNRHDRDLGMNRAITRRDFLNGVSVAIGGTLLSSPVAKAMGLLPEEAYYPPALTGMRGSHDGSWETSHALRDGQGWNEVADTGERYDLVVVGGGISGLSAAYFYRRKFGGDSRILVIDNHDDFGGHAKRNEFTHEGRTFIGYGGTQSIDTPSSYSAEAMGLLTELGVDLARFYEAFDQELYSSLGLTRGTFFDRETFGDDRLVARPTGMSWKDFAAQTPLVEDAQKDLIRLNEEAIDYLPGLSPDEKTKKLAATSYLAFLEEHAKVHPQVVKMLYKRTHGLFAMGIDGVPALDCWGLGYPGFQGMGPRPAKASELSLTARPHREPQPYIFHFPDGNASIARLLTRSLVLGSAPGGTMEDIVTAKMDYSKLDVAGSRIRVRLRSTGVRVQHVGDPDRATEVEVTYVRDGNAESVRARHVVLGCWHMVIPLLCPELGEEQRKALVYGPKVPLVYTNVFVRDWKAFEKLGVSSISATNGYHSSISLDFPVSLGGYRHPRSPEEPIVLHLTRTPCSPGGSSREQHAAGRYDLLATTFETFERETRAQLGRVLAGGGFDPSRDILGITVNRWPHGYAYEYNSLWDPVFPPGEAPFEIGRKPFGRIHIANSDAQAYAYTNAAIDQAYRAVSEIG
ncbi:MAG TPA: FAD-dependent oxidoreductase [Vicinamibacteria bacterium]|nr:FAD-dependent oxidoreductase [Vicinamibacteria bacterium]